MSSELSEGEPDQILGEEQRRGERAVSEERMDGWMRFSVHGSGPSVG